MDRRNFLYLTTAIIGSSLCTGAFAAEAWIENLNSAFNSVRTAYAPFVQTNPNGARIKGRFYMYKPGKMRFEYDDKRYPLTVADGKILAIFDQKSRLGPQKYPQGSTPVSLLARTDISLTDSQFVRKINQNASNGEALITLADPKNPQYGQIIIRYSTRDNQLKGWESIDRSGARTQVELESWNTGLELNPALFDIVKIEKEWANR